MLRRLIYCVVLAFGLNAHAAQQYLLEAPAGHYRGVDIGEPGKRNKFGFRIKMQEYALGTKWPPGAYVGFYEGEDRKNSVQFMLLKHPEENILLAAYRHFKDGEEIEYKSLSNIESDEEVFVKVAITENKIYILLEGANPVSLRTTLTNAIPYISVSSGSAIFSEEDVADWKPEDIPDPDGMYEKVINDVNEGRYEEALNTHLWYHHNALTYAPSHYGVRLSYMLHHWYGLAQLYPPALQAMKETRDTAGNRVREGDDIRNAFNDYESINKVLGEDEKTVELFIWLDGTHPAQAKRIIDLAKPALMKAKEYALMGKYLDPDNEYLKIVWQYENLLEYANESKSPETLDYAHDNFSHEVAELVVLLVLNGRYEEAEEIAEMALLERDTPTFNQMLNNALNGIPPDPYP